MKRLGLVLILLSSCHAEVPVGATPCEAACKVMLDASCPEGLDPQCVSSCDVIWSAGYVWTTDTSGPACVRKASGVEQIRACNVRCAK